MSAYISLIIFDASQFYIFFFDFCHFLPSIGRPLGQMLSLRATELHSEGTSPSLDEDELEIMILSAVVLQVC